MVRELPKALRDVVSDEYETPEVGGWAELKYRLHFHYANMFATAMKAKWDQRVYVDLFASAGKARVKGGPKVVLTSALLALSVDSPFDRYILCETNPELRTALRSRVAVAHGDKDVRYVERDCNTDTRAIIEEMPPVGKGATSLAFCFVDPCRVGHFKFSTIRNLASRFVDFLVLIPTGMDITRNLSIYRRSENNALDEFLGDRDWREKLARARRAGDAADVAITRIFGEQMKQLRYRYGGVEDSVLVRYDPKNVPLYRLGFFSRHPLGGRFWKQARRLSDPQRSLLDE